MSQSRNRMVSWARYPRLVGLLLAGGALIACAGPNQARATSASTADSPAAPDGGAAVGAANDATASVAANHGAQPAVQPPTSVTADEAADGVLPNAEAVAATGPASESEVIVAKALEQCQAAAKLLDQGDQPDAISLIDQAYAALLQLPDTEGAEAQSKQDLRLLIADIIARSYRTSSPNAAKPDSSAASFDLAMPMYDNAHVQQEIKSFLTVESNQLLEGYRRSGRYRQMILAKLEQAGLPSQLSWLPLVESAFQVRALSRASALGLWQFISSTGLRYKLRRDEWVDERLDPEKATDAALAYLTDLHRLFGDWPKALAGYNCGEGSIARAQSNAAGQYLDFWDVYAVLPNETRRYVPRLLAVLQIVENPKKFGITLPEPDPPMGEFVKVTVRRPVRLDALDAALKLQPGTLAQLNPELRFGATPSREYELRVPRECTADGATAAVASLPDYAPPKPEYELYYVRSGETLSVIAARYHASVTAIVRINGLRSSHRIWAGQRLRIPLRR